jgi:hypothetical protein
MIQEKQRNANLFLDEVTEEFANFGWFDRIFTEETPGCANSSA